MPLNETLNLNITEAQRQISVLEGQLDQLSRPVTIPVNVQGGGELNQVRQELDSSEGAASELNRELSETDDLLRTTGREATRTGQDLETAGRKGSTAFGNLRTSVTALAGSLVAFAGAQALGQFLGNSITAASNLEQSLGALDAVFGDLGDEVASFGEIADQSVGLAASQFNQLASVLGSQLQTFGFNVEDAATETQRLIGLASDLAATFGGPVSQAVEAISSLLRGEVNPIERYGVAMNEASVQARALEDGLAGTASELTFQDKTMGRLAILYEQTANAQGQFGREAETTAGQMERLNAEWENTQAIVGGALVPALQAVLPIISDLAQSIGVIGLQLAATFELIDSDVATLQILGIQSGLAAESVVLLAGGVGRLQAELEALDRFSFGDTGAEDLTERIDTLVAAWAGGSVEAQQFIDNMEYLADQFRLTEEAADALRDALEQRIASGFATAEDAALLGNLAREFERAGEAAAEAAPAFELTRRELQGLESIGQIEFENPFEGLPDQLDAAGRALETEEEEIVETFAGFLADLEAEIEAQRTFRTNIQLLESFGFSELADVFREAGLDAASALAEAVADPGEAAKAEALLVEEARRLAIAEVDAFAATLEGQLEGVNLEPIRIPIEADLSNFRVPTDIAGRIGVPAGSVGGSNVVVNNVYNTPPPPAPDQARAAQITSSIIASNAR